MSPTTASPDDDSDPETEWLAWAWTQFIWTYCMHMKVSVSVLLGVWWFIPGVVRNKWSLDGWLETYFRACALWYIPMGDVSACLLGVGIDWGVWEQALLAGLGLGCIAISQGGVEGMVGVVICCVGVVTKSVKLSVPMIEGRVPSRLLCLAVSCLLIFCDALPNEGVAPRLPSPVVLLFLSASSFLLPPSPSTPTAIPEPFFAFLLSWFFSNSLPTPYSMIGACEIAASVGLNQWQNAGGYKDEGTESGDSYEDVEAGDRGAVNRAYSRDYPRVQVTLGEE